MKRRLIYVQLSIFFFLLEILIIKLFNDVTLVRGFLGDLIVVMLIYCLIKLFYDINSRKVVISVLIFSFSIEGLQYFKFINYLGLSKNRLAQIILGSTFDLVDLLAYVIGVSVLYFIDTRMIRG